jgi:hypothetical protein
VVCMRRVALVGDELLGLTYVLTHMSGRWCCYAGIVMVEFVPLSIKLALKLMVRAARRRELLVTLDEWRCV